jgi:hypothetical protein
LLVFIEIVQSARTVRHGNPQTGFRPPNPNTNKKTLRVFSFLTDRLIQAHSLLGIKGTGPAFEQANCARIYGFIDFFVGV